MIPKQTDSPLEEIHAIRRAISDRFGGDVAAIAADAACRQAASNRAVWRPKATKEELQSIAVAGLACGEKAIPAVE